MGSREKTGPLRGIRVLDFTQGLAGPLATKDLAELGATVIKVEWDEGDWTRDIGPTTRSGETALFIACNRSKSSLQIHPEDASDWELLAGLGDDADVVVTDWLTNEAIVSWTNQLVAQRPRVVKAVLAAAPPSLRSEVPVTSELTAQAYAGLWQYQGAWYEDGSEPVRVGIDVSSAWTGVALSQGIMLALIDRESRSGDADSVEVSQLGATIVNQLCHFAWDSDPTERNPTIGQSAPFNSPYHGVPTADVNVSVGLGTGIYQDDDQAFGAFHDRFGIDSRWNHFDMRQADPAGLSRAWSEALKQVPSSEILDWVFQHGGRAVPLNTMSSLAAHPQVLAMDMLAQLRLENGQEVATVGLPWKFSSTPGSIRCSPPRLGAQNELIKHHGWNLEAAR